MSYASQKTDLFSLCVHVARRTGIYYCCNMIMIAVTSVTATLILYMLHHYQDKPVPDWARKVCNVISLFTI